MDFLTPEFIAGVGFPIAVTVYLLVRMETTINSLTIAVENLSTIVKDVQYCNRKV